MNRVPAFVRDLGLRGALSHLVQPVVGFAAGLLALIWLATWQQIETERITLEKDSLQTVDNLAIVFEQNVARTLSEVDGVLTSLIELAGRADLTVDWSELLKNRRISNDQLLQLAVADAAGTMIGSSLGLPEDKPVSIADRDHFRVHAGRAEDQLFISKPILGRISNKWSIQLTRRLSRPDRSFAGVIVASLDPELLTKAYSSIRLGHGSGIALIGTDEIIRFGTGVYADHTGKGVREDMIFSSAFAGNRGPVLAREPGSAAVRAVASRPVQRHPLYVIIVGGDVSLAPIRLANRHNYLLGASLLSIIILLSTMVAIRNRVEHECHINNLAHRDSLTGLANRRHFQAALDAAVSKLAGGRTFALFLVDLDRFKAVNDIYGHPIGDKLLVQVADRLRSRIRRIDLVARLGGDEFAILLPTPGTRSTSVSEMSTIAGRLCHALNEPFTIGNIKVSIGGTIGIALAPENGDSSAALFKAADLALYSSKTAGRGGFCYFEEKMRDAATERVALEADLGVAIEKNQLEVHYQSIVDIRSGRIAGYEALLRWRHPERGLISPTVFIPIAEESGLIVKIGFWVLRQACHDIASQPSPLKVAVNFSPLQFKDPQLVDKVRLALAESRLQPSRLEVEITESTLLQQDAVTVGHLHALNALGIRVLMDDFGTGYSSLSYLQAFPFSCIKIDRSFVSSLGDNPDAMAIVRAITSLANSLGMETVAEGVESREQLDLLMTLDCTRAQGFYLSRPGPASEVLPSQPQHQAAEAA